MLLLLRSVLLTLLLAGGVSTAAATTLDLPEGRVILTVSGAIEVTNKDGTAVFDLASLEGLGLAEVRTDSPWTDGMTTFQGVLVRDLIARLGASGSQMRANAWDDYTVTIPTTDFDAYDAILATRRDGVPMKMRDKGPIWVIYPWSDVSELQKEEHYAKAIWQVRELIFE